MTRSVCSRRDQLKLVLAGAACAFAPSAANAQFHMPTLPSLPLPGLNNNQDENHAPQPPIQPGRQSRGPAGYSLRYEPVRARLRSCDFSGAISQFSVTSSSPIAGAAADDEQASRPLLTSNDDFLANSELGIMNFESGNYDIALEKFNIALQAAGKREGFLRRIGRGFGGFILGRGDFGPYRQRDFEEILQLNYLALNFLIQGDRKSYNVARRSGLVQRQLHDQFREKIEQAQKALRDEQNKPENANASIGEILGPEFASFAPTARRVPNAYVNPLGPYVSAVVLEIASLEQPALRGNARAAYEEAAGLLTNGQALTRAAQAMGSPATPGERVVHVIVAEGLVPSRQLLRFGLQWGNQVYPLRLGQFLPEQSHVGVIDARFGGGAPVALDPIGDIEALVMRDQEDRLPQTYLDVVISAARDSEANRRTDGARRLLSEMTFGAVNLSFDSTPDMRSWASLPRRVHVARLLAPTGATELRLRVRNSSGGIIIQQTVPLNPEYQQSLIYARATDTSLHVDQSRRLWVDGVDLEE
jgi:uncharacterized protein